MGKIKQDYDLVFFYSFVEKPISSIEDLFSRV